MLLVFCKTVNHIPSFMDPHPSLSRPFFVPCPINVCLFVYLYKDWGDIRVVKVLQQEHDVVLYAFNCVCILHLLVSFHNSCFMLFFPCLSTSSCVFQAHVKTSSTLIKLGFGRLYNIFRCLLSPHAFYHPPLPFFFSMKCDAKLCIIGGIFLA